MVCLDLSTFLSLALGRSRWSDAGAVQQPFASAALRHPRRGMIPSKTGKVGCLEEHGTISLGHLA
jgi:hypothetical protein